MLPKCASALCVGWITGLHAAAQVPICGAAVAGRGDDPSGERTHGKTANGAVCDMLSRPSFVSAFLMGCQF
jgi:hypothetical protein